MSYGQDKSRYFGIFRVKYHAIFDAFAFTLFLFHDMKTGYPFQKILSNPPAAYSA